MRYDPEQKRVIYQPVTIDPREVTPRIVREEHYAEREQARWPEIRNYTLNFGPQHPAAHGVLRLVLELDGEVIQRADPHIGLLHRATEKLAEHKTYIQSVPYMDRLDYVSMMCNEHAYVLAIEKLLGIEVPLRAQYIRVMFDEITRILNHLLWLGAHGLDIGAMTVFLYCFREREDLMDAYEAVSGRAHARGVLPPGRRVPRPARSDAAVPGFEVRNERDAEGAEPQPPGLAARLHRGLHRALSRSASTTTRRCSPRTASGSSARSASAWSSPERAMALGFTGPMLRGSGIAWDLRKKQPYEVYDKVDFDIPVGKNGDCYDRYLVRVEEFRQSNRIIKQCIDWLRKNPGPVMVDNHKIAPPSRAEMKLNMEELIHHFKLFTEGMHVPEGEAYAAVEAPEGRVRHLPDLRRREQALPPEDPRSPAFRHLAAIDEMARGHMIADAVAIIGTQDIVFGEIDR